MEATQKLGVPRVAKKEEEITVTTSSSTGATTTTVNNFLKHPLQWNVWRKERLSPPPQLLNLETPVAFVSHIQRSSSYNNTSSNTNR